MNFQFGMYWRYGGKKGSFTLVHRPFREGIRDFRPAFVLIAQDVLEPYVMRAFQTEGKSDGIKWADLAPSTLRGRPNTPILQVTGALLRSFKQGDPEHVQDIGMTKLLWGSRNITSLFHEFGTGARVDFKRAGARKVVAKSAIAQARLDARRALQPESGKHGMPARPPLVYSRFLANEITSKLLGRVAQVARQTGYAVTQAESGFGKISPTEARQIGSQMLRS